MRRLSLIVPLVLALAACGGSSANGARTAGATPSVSTVATGLQVPWEIAFLPGGDALITERPGRVRLLTARRALRPVAGIPVVTGGENGLLGLAVDPAFARNRLVYLFLTTRSGNVVRRYRYSDGRFAFQRTIVRGIRAADNHDGGRLRFGPDRRLYISTGDATQPSLAQDRGALNGKLLRLGLGAARGRGGRPQIVSLGHRNPQGFDWQPGTGRLYEDEHGQTGNDEMNLIRAGANYGWPLLQGGARRGRLHGAADHVLAEHRAVRGDVRAPRAARHGPATTSWARCAASRSVVCASAGRACSSTRPCSRGASGASARWSRARTERCTRSRTTRTGAERRSRATTACCGSCRRAPDRFAGLRPGIPLALALVLVLGVLVAAPPAGAASEPYVAIRGYDEPGTPANYDKVFVRKFGSASAKRVLVLVPGFVSGSGDFTLVARELVKRVPGLQVWAEDRRSNALEDTSRFQPGTSADEAYDYYLDKLAFKIVDGPRDAPFARGWGLKVAMEDLRRVILAAKRGGHKVILGGHSLGGSSTVAYATWDFKGKPGYKDVDGLVLIDGGLLGSFDSANLSQARRRKAKIDSGEPFSALLEGLPRGRPVCSQRSPQSSPSRRPMRSPRPRTTRCCPPCSGPRSP